MPQGTATQPHRRASSRGAALHVAFTSAGPAAGWNAVAISRAVW